MFVAVVVVRVVSVVSAGAAAAVFCCCFAVVSLIFSLCFCWVGFWGFLGCLVRPSCWSFLVCGVSLFPLFVVLLVVLWLLPFYT